MKTSSLDSNKYERFEAWLRENGAQFEMVRFLSATRARGKGRGIETGVI